MAHIVTNREMQIDWFRRGYRDGRTIGSFHPKGLSTREALAMNPSLAAGIAEHYINGFEDGLKGDDWRLKLL